MITEADLKKIKKVVEVFFQKMGFSAEIKELFIEEETVFLKLKSEEPKVLIGKNGRTLNEIRHILRALLRKKFPENFFFDVDVNNYKEKKIEYLKEIADETADNVSLTKKEKVLPPMSSYERRIIHLKLAERSDVVTESVGEDMERKIVVKPKL